MQAIHVADFFFPHCSALSPAPLYVSSALAEHCHAMPCDAFALLCRALPCLALALPCYAELIYAFALLSVALPCYALAVPCHAKRIFAMPLLCDADLCASVSGLALAVLCCPLPCLAFAMLVRAQLCNALAVPCKGKFSSLRFGNRYISPSIRHLTQPVGQTFVPHNRTAQPLLRLCLCLAVQCFPSQCLRHVFLGFAMPLHCASKPCLCCAPHCSSKPCHCHAYLSYAIAVLF